MKVIFLDFDGVLNSETSFLYEHNRRKRDNEQGVKGPVNETLSAHCCAAFREVLLTYPDVKIVLSTTWRTMFDLEWLKAKLAEYKIDSTRVIGKTPVDYDFGRRGIEIAIWLKEHPEVTHYVAIDDNDWEISQYHGDDRFVKTDWERGMGTNHAKELIFKLSAKNQKLVEERIEKERVELEKAREEAAKNPKPPMDDDF